MDHRAAENTRVWKAHSTHPRWAPLRVTTTSGDATQTVRRVHPGAEFQHKFTVQGAL